MACDCDDDSDNGIEAYNGKDSQSECSNYRGNALFSVAGKVFLHTFFLLYIYGTSNKQLHSLALLLLHLKQQQQQVGG